MDVKRSVRNIILSSLLFICGANAEIVTVDLHGSIYNTYIGNSYGDYEWGGFSWSLKDLFAFDSPINFSFSYDAAAPSLEAYKEDGASWNRYKGLRATISSPLFGLRTSKASSVSISVVDDVPPGWDILYVDFADSGVKLDHSGDSYFLVGGGISFYDESGLSIDSSNLPQSQEVFEDFWRNRPADAYFDQVASFYLHFKKQPVFDSAEYSFGDIFTVIGYFDEARLSKVPEPAGFVLLLVGLFGVLSIRHCSCTY